MKTTKQIEADMAYSGTNKMYFYAPVVALGFNSNVETQDVYFKHKEDAIEYAKELIDEGYRLKVGFPAKEHGYISVLFESLTGDGYNVESRATSTVVYQL